MFNIEIDMDMGMEMTMDMFANGGLYIDTYLCDIDKVFQYCNSFLEIRCSNEFRSNPINNLIDIITMMMMMMWME